MDCHQPDGVRLRRRRQPTSVCFLVVTGGCASFVRVRVSAQYLKHMSRFNCEMTRQLICISVHNNYSHFFCCFITIYTAFLFTIFFPLVKYINFISFTRDMQDFSYNVQHYIWLLIKVKLIIPKEHKLILYIGYIWIKINFYFLKKIT